MIGGLGASQFPEYTQQYTQRLGGAVSELSNVVSQFDTDAARNGLSRDAALEQYARSGEAFLVQRGESIKDIIKRHDRLSAHMTELQTAAPFQRLWVFAKSRDNNLAEDTLAAYKPAVPVTLEGAAHAGGGALGGWALSSFFLAPFGRRRKRVTA